MIPRVAIHCIAVLNEAVERVRSLMVALLDSSLDVLTQKSVCGPTTSLGNERILFRFLSSSWARLDLIQLIFAVLLNLLVAKLLLASHIDHLSYSIGTFWLVS